MQDPREEFLTKKEKISVDTTPPREDIEQTVLFKKIFQHCKLTRRRKSDSIDITVAT